MPARNTRFHEADGMQKALQRVASEFNKPPGEDEPLDEHYHPTAGDGTRYGRVARYDKEVGGKVAFGNPMQGEDIVPEKHVSAPTCLNRTMYVSVTNIGGSS